MVGAEHRAQRADAGDAVLDAALVGVVAEDVDAVGAGQVEGDVAVEIADPHAVRGLDEAADAQLLADQPPELERHAIAVVNWRSEMDSAAAAVAASVRGARVASSWASRVKPARRRSATSKGAPSAAKKRSAAVLVERHQPRQPLRRGGRGRAAIGAWRATSWMRMAIDGGQHW